MIAFFNKIYGCQANFADSQGLAKFLIELGCTPVNTEAQADIIIINTCAIREKAEQRLCSYIGKLEPLKKEKPHLKIGIIGCVASYRKQEFFKRFDHISFIHGAREEISELQGYLADLVSKLQMAKSLFEQHPETRLKFRGQDRNFKKILKNNDSILAPASISSLNLAEYLKPEDPEVAEHLSPVRSLINIMTGCNKYCAYCIVPFTRGREISYPMTDILNAVKNELARGIKEITLLGQNVNSYIDPQTGARFPELLQKVAQLEVPQLAGQFWVRFVSPHPQDLTKDLFQVMAKNREKLTAFLHFPLQSGSDKILKAMNRNYTVEQFLEKIEWAKSLLPGVAFTTDIIVGFPGETEQDYQATLDVMEKVRFDQIYSFIYSRRKFTKAFDLQDDTPAEEKARRLSQLQKRQRVISLEQNQQNIGKTLKVLVEKEVEPGKLLARTEANARVYVYDKPDLVGKFVNVKIESTTVVNLTGKRIDL